MNKVDSITIISQYRERLRSDHENPGWNKWALIGAIASLLWIILTMSYENELETNDSIKLMVVIIIFHSLCDHLMSFFSFSRDDSPIYIRINQVADNNLLEFLIRGIFYVGLIMYSHVCIPANGQFVGKIYYFFIYLSAIFYVGSIFGRAIEQDIAFGKFKSKFGRRLFIIAQTLIIIAYALVLFFLFEKINGWKSILMWKSGLLFFGFKFSLEKLCHSFRKNPLVEEIDSLIDDVTFGRIKPKESLKKLEIIMFGLSAQDIASEMLAEILRIDKLIRQRLISIKKLATDYEAEVTPESRLFILEKINHLNLEFHAKEGAQFIKFMDRLKFRRFFDGFFIEEKKINETLSPIYKSMARIVDEIKETANHIREVELKTETKIM